MWSRTKNVLFFFFYASVLLGGNLYNGIASSAVTATANEDQETLENEKVDSSHVVVASSKNSRNNKIPPRPHLRTLQDTDDYTPSPSVSSRPTTFYRRGFHEVFPCGRTFCFAGKICCNASCGTCTKPGDTCDQKICT